MVVGDYESGMSEWRMVIEGSQVKIGLLMNPNFTIGDLLVTLRTEKFKLANFAVLLRDFAHTSVVWFELSLNSTTNKHR